MSSSHQEEMNSSWTSASYVANKYYTGIIGAETNSNFYDDNAEFKGKIDTYELERQNETSNYIAANKRLMSVKSTSVESRMGMIDGTLTRVDTITFSFEATTVKYTRVDVTTPSDEDITRKTTTNYYTIVDGNLTIEGEEIYSKDYKSGDKDKKEDYIEGNYTDEAVINKIDEYKEDMNRIASDYRATVTINGEISSYYYETHDEITQDTDTGKVVINTILDKYQVYSLTGTAESNMITYTLNDDKENQISFKDFEGIVFVFNSTDILNITDEELQVIADDMEVDIEEIRKMGTQVIENAKNAVQGKGTLVGLYDFSISNGNGLKEEATGGFNIRLKMTDEMKKYNDFSIAYLKDDGSLEEIIKLTQNGDYLEGVLSHLSTYVIIGNNVEKTSEKQTSENSKTPSTGDNIAMWFSLMIISMIGVTGTVKSLKKIK
ncbi:MAG: hypothetical protein IKG56_01785 [Clostridia bacterium]|nr:hypothetical protein [Clostridia bacterium]